VDTEDFKEALSQWGTGVTIVTTCWEGRNYGVTINSFTSLSLDPLLILFGLRQQSSVHEIFCKAPFFAVTILSDKQAQLSEIFTHSSQVSWSEIPFYMSSQKCPLFRDSLVSLECQSFQTYAVGDHEVIIGHVVETYQGDEKKPLLYFQRQYWQLGEMLS
jgi:flavin reductase (DIM6/NTAB) family NADH-FMN oxidoreductase RutF